MGQMSERSGGMLDQYDNVCQLPGERSNPIHWSRTAGVGNCKRTWNNSLPCTAVRLVSVKRVHSSGYVDILRVSQLAHKQRRKRTHAATLSIGSRWQDCQVLTHIASVTWSANQPSTSSNPTKIKHLCKFIDASFLALNHVHVTRL